MKSVVFTINGIEVSTRLNDNAELGKEKLLEDTKDLVKDDKEAIVKAVMALPRDEHSTVSQYRVKLENVIVDGKPSMTNLVKLAASLIPDASMKLAVRDSHHKRDASDVRPDEGVIAEWKAAMLELKDASTRYPKLTLFFGVEDPLSAAIKALMAIGYSEEEAKKMAVLKK